MNVLVTGSKGFIGKHICYALKQRGHRVLEYDKNNTIEELENSIQKCDWIIHLAGAMRPKDKNDYYTSNSDLTKTISNIIIQKRVCPSIIFTSSIQSSLNNDYGMSKLQAENILFDLNKTNGNKTYIFRLTNAFGKWGLPNYNSVVSTFCYNISHDLPIRIDDPNKTVNFIYIDDIVKTFIDAVEGKKEFRIDDINSVYPIYPITVGDLAKKLAQIHKLREAGDLSFMTSNMDKILYDTFLTYYEISKLSYSHKFKDAGNIKCISFLQNTKQGNCRVCLLEQYDGKPIYHDSYSEKIVVLSGECKIKMQRMYQDQCHEIMLSESKNNVMDLPAGYYYSFEKVGNNKCLLLSWENSNGDE